MTYTDFLKSHFGDDGSLARVLQELGTDYYKTRTGQYGLFQIVKLGKKVFLWNNGLDYVRQQSPETQRKIAELLGWTE